MRDTLDERLARSLRRMVPGGFAGRSEQVSPVRTPLAPLKTYQPIPAATFGGVVFDFPGPLYATVTPAWRPPSAGITTTEARATLIVVASTDTHFDVLKNGVSVLTVVVAAGLLQSDPYPLVVDFAGTDTMQGQDTLPGVGGGGGSLQIS